LLSLRSHRRSNHKRDFSEPPRRSCPDWRKAVEAVAGTAAVAGQLAKTVAKTVVDPATEATKKTAEALTEISKETSKIAEALINEDKDYKPYVIPILKTIASKKVF
jgi:hypothetical protein